MRIAEDAFEFKIPMAVNPEIGEAHLRYNLIYALKTADGYVLIDAGSETPQGFETFEAQLRDAGIAPRDITLIVGTHGHFDHIGMASRIKELTGARMALHRRDATTGYVLAFRPGFVPPEVDLLLEGGEELVPGSGLQVVWTPGHTPGHVCIHDTKRRLLFTGDHILPTITPNVSLFPGDEANPLANFRESQLAVKKLDVQMVHPGHEYAFPNLGRRVDEILHHHDLRNQEVLDALNDGPKTAWEVASRIRWNTGPWEGFKPGTRRSALWETMAHIRGLAAEGLVIAKEQGSGGLLEELRSVASSTADRRTALVGTGMLGKAIMRQAGDAPDGFRVVAAFDADPRQIGGDVGGVTVQPVERLAEVLTASGIRNAVVAVPGPYVQDVVDRLADSGVTAILNCAPVELRVPLRVQVRSLDAAMVLQASTCYAHANRRDH